MVIFTIFLKNLGFSIGLGLCRFRLNGDGSNSSTGACICSLDTIYGRSVTVGTQGGSSGGVSVVIPVVYTYLSQKSGKAPLCSDSGKMNGYRWMFGQIRPRERLGAI